MNEILYSVIIPHYNIPQLLGRCLRSIPERDDMQIIVVDDCSPNSKNYTELIPELSRSNVEFYSTPQGGSAGRARNIGIKYAKGVWLTFLDADDLFVDDLDLIIDKNKDCDADVIYYQSKSVMNDDLSELSNRNIFNYNFEIYFRTGNEQALRLEFDAPWGKFVRKSLIDKYNIQFDEVRYSNDTFFSAALGVFANKIFVSRDIIYIVTERSDSLTSDKMKTIEEWSIRFHSALRVQDFFDCQKIHFRRYAFADFLLLMWRREKKVFLKEYCSLSNKNKFRYLYHILRSCKRKK